MSKKTILINPKICIVGPGIVGQATGKVFTLHDYDVTFLGGSPDKVEKLRSEGFKAFPKDELFNGDYTFDITFLTVPTPTQNGKISLEAIKSAATDLGRRIKKLKSYHLVVVKSTVPPGTSENLVIKIIEKYSGKKVGVDFGCCMNPEYLREKTAFEDTLQPWIVVIGQYDKKSGEILSALYRKFDCPVVTCSLQEAEMQKYVHNLYNAVKITFFNEMRHIGKNIGADAEKIFKLTAISAEGMWNPKYGIKDFGPFQGSCLPKDTQAFLEWAENKELDIDLLRSVIQVNNKHAKQLGLDKSNYEIGSRL